MSPSEDNAADDQEKQTVSSQNSNSEDSPRVQEEDNWDGSSSKSCTPRSRVKCRGPVQPGSPNVFNPEDPREAGDQTYDHTPIQGWKHLDEIYDLLLAEEEPTSFRLAKGKREWDQAMASEMASIEKNKTWVLTELPSEHRPIGLKWIFKVKKNAQGDVIRHKARLVAKGYIQEHGIDYDEVFAPVARMETIRLILALAAQKGWAVHHLDVKTAFLHGDLKEDVFVSQPEGFIKTGREHMVYKLSKALYGLKQAPRAWNLKLNGVLKEYGFRRCKLEQAVYIRHSHKEPLIVGIYVDDLIVTGRCIEDIKLFKRQMENKFEMSDLGMLSYYLGLEVKHEVDATEYRDMSKGLCGEDLETNWDVSMYMHSPRETHLQAVKHMLRYIKGTTNWGINYKRRGNECLIGFSDSSFSVDQDDGKGTTGTVFYYNGGPITWNSQKQPTVALSSCEAEFMAATSAACQVVWLRGLLAEITGKQEEPVLIRVDNKSAISLMKNPVFHGRSKHINTRYHYIRECVELEQIKVEHVSGDQQRADILTKPLPKLRFAEMRQLLGMEQIEESAT
ncbi:hypothetical protein E3N88_31503 [Mikania micrantha]|uniref:Reverse transcriptase Ty1/copia-type domain-containing protein n=1 Tax=Mikania micrantha TaxID=192012 RepID=A0A5N6MQH4_9ASTR|nr:hypothetical protein E3N88_31503 [Mikania micrantha]